MFEIEVGHDLFLSEKMYCRNFYVYESIFINKYFLLKSTPIYVYVYYKDIVITLLITLLIMFIFWKNWGGTTFTFYYTSVKLYFYYL